MSIKQFTVNFLIILAAIIVCPSVWAGDYYVNGSTGNDLNSGTIQSPWKSIAKANGSLKAGDTVFIRKGDYFETISPTNNGSEGNYITYSNYNNELVTIKRVSTAIYLVNKKYININGISVDGEEIGNGARVNFWVNLDGGSYNVIQNCNFQKAKGWTAIGVRQGAHHNKILNNTMKYNGNYETDSGDMIKIEVADYNILEGNTASYSGHNILNLEGKYNVIRNNDFSNPWERVIEVRNYRTPICEYNIIENNRIHGASPAIDNAVPPAIKLGGNDQIVRNNMIYNNVAYGFQMSPGSQYPDAHHLRIYNNVFYKNGRESIFVTPWVTEANTSSIRVKNNIFYNNGSDTVFYLIPESGDFNDIHIHGNNIATSTASEGKIRTKAYGTNNFSWYESNYGSNVTGNVAINPQFVDALNGNFELKSTSPMVDAGTFPTKITSNSGSGSSFVVADAGYFTDGFGIIESDQIQIQGSSQPVKITGIDYTNNVISIDRTISWKQGDGVALPFKGLRPDLGAFEAGGGTPAGTISAPVGLRIVSN